MICDGKGGTPRQQDFEAIANNTFPRDIVYVDPPRDRGHIDASSFVETSHIAMICQAVGYFLYQHHCTALHCTAPDIEENITLNSIHYHHRLMVGIGWWI
jgi:hypothetical protein